MAENNLATWEALRTPDPEHTKKFTRAGGFRGTAIKPIYCDHQMTKLFGPCGEGWTISEPTFQLVNGPEGEIAVYCWLTLTVKDGKPIPGVGGDFVVKKTKYGLTMDDEAFKKAETDAIGNAMKHLGMAADIHMGLFDDSKYVAEIGRDDAVSPTGSVDARADVVARNTTPAANDDARQKAIDWTANAIAGIKRADGASAITSWEAKAAGHIDGLKARHPDLYNDLTKAINARLDAFAATA